MDDTVRQVNLRCFSRQWLLVARHITRGLLVTLLLAGVIVRRFAYFILLPVQVSTSYYKPSPLSQLSLNMAKRSIDSAMIAMIPIVVATWIW